uniref:Uncharacterized protein n=1 Tax=Megaselia scalaris TaxID=36166 RepID=T1GJK5_MEGSC
MEWNDCMMAMPWLGKVRYLDSEKIAKINRLLEILLNPQQRIPLETLLKCEKALERMDILHIAPSNKHHFLETVNTVLQTPTGHHTLYRTFHPSFESLFGTDIQMSSIPKKRSMPVEESQETPHVLQGEIARLDQKFKVTLDPATQNQNKTLTLNCCLDDKCLPWVPPICVTIPENYPFISPTCTLNKQEYTATPFLSSVEKSLASRIGKLPKLHSLSHILDTWEMSVRQACSPTSSALTAEDALADILAF